MTQAGHRAVAVDSGTNIASALADAPYDVVIADYGDAGRIKNDVEAASPRPEILPILYKPAQAVEAEAERQFVCLIKPHVMTKYDALAEIDRLMELKLAGGAAVHGH